MRPFRACLCLALVVVAGHGREAARAAEWAHAALRPWAAGDLLLVDNLRVAHGRAPFSGHRTVLVGMGGWPS